MRICLRTNIPVSQTVKDGKVIYESTAVATLGWIDAFDRVFGKSSFTFAERDYEVCEEELASNTTDLSTELYLTSEKYTNFTIPAPSWAQKAVMLGAYDMANVTKYEMASALTSYRLLETAVYMATGTLLLILLLALIAFSLFKHHRRVEALLMMENSANGFDRDLIRMKRQLLTQKGFTIGMVKNQVSSFFKGSGCDFKWIGFLVTMLIFYVVFYFNSVYSTSSIVLRGPKLLTTYSEVAEHPTASAYFSDFMLKVSTNFKNAPASSVKGRIWKKHFMLQKEGSGSGYAGLIIQCYLDMRDKKSVTLASSMVLPIAKGTFCALSPPEELRYIKVSADQSEHENVYGFALSVHFKSVKKVIAGLRLIEQSDVYSTLVAKAADQYFDMSRMLMGKSKGEVLRQQKACDGQLTVQVEPLQPVKLRFWFSLIRFLLGVQLIALLVLCIEKGIAKNEIKMS